MPNVFTTSDGAPIQGEGRIEYLYHDEQTLFTVFRALMSTGLKEDSAMQLITAMQNAGILFRERPRTEENTYKVPYVLPHSRACGPQAHLHGTACHVNCPTCKGKPHFEEDLVPKKVPEPYFGDPL